MHAAPAGRATEQALLEVTGLQVDFSTQDGCQVRAVDGVSLAVAGGECLAVVGESGSGKTQVLNACLGLLAGNGRAGGSVRFRGAELLGAPEAQLNAVRGLGIGLISQDPMSSLTPHLRIGTLLTEALLDRGLADASQARERALEALRDVGIAEPEARLRQYPHELSGGMRQRVALAAALMCRPPLLFADEPTTALDVSVQARILELLAAVRERGVGILLITHDLGVVAGLADRVAVMYAGRIVETADVEQLFARPSHPYTSALLAAVPRIAGRDAGRPLANIPGQPPRPGEQGPGCAYAPRCPRAADVCRATRPALAGIDGGHVPGGAQVACHRPVTVWDRAETVP
jgi:oligopeptide/dipeptide ABC transporter ATP-binding protein